MTIAVAAVAVDEYQPVTLVYLARAVTPGTYQVPQPMVESMAFPQWQATGAAEDLLIVRPYACLLTKRVAADNAGSRAISPFLAAWGADKLWPLPPHEVNPARVVVAQMGCRFWRFADAEGICVIRNNRRCFSTLP